MESPGTVGISPTYLPTYQSFEQAQDNARSSYAGRLLYQFRVLFWTRGHVFHAFRKRG